VEPLKTDLLTGLEVLTEGRLAAVRAGACLAYIDLVRFRDRVNAPFGHVVGDAVLAEVARRLAEALAPWRVFRSGGDEFTVEVCAALDRDGARQLAERVATVLAPPFEQTCEGQEATVGVCLSVVVDDPRPAWVAAIRGAQVEARRHGVRVWVAGDPE
jgi:diguanylate cyclase (GGDEF)-like protein